MNLSWSFFFSDIDGVLKSANGTEYGLASGVFTKDLSKVWFNFFKASICFQLFYYSFLAKKDMCSGIFRNIHSCKWTALLTAGCLHKTPFISTPIQTLYFYILVSGQLQLLTPLSSPEPQGCSLTRASTGSLTYKIFFQFGHHSWSNNENNIEW